MRKVLVCFEVSVTQDMEKPFISVYPDYIFQREFDKDDEKYFQDLSELEGKVELLVRVLKSLDCRVIATKKVISRLDFV